MITAGSAFSKQCSVAWGPNELVKQDKYFCSIILYTKKIELRKTSDAYALVTLSRLIKLSTQTRQFIW